MDTDTDRDIDVGNREMEIDWDRVTNIDMDIKPAEISAEGYNTPQQICSEGYPAQILSRRIIITMQKFVKGV